MSMCMHWYSIGLHQFCMTMLDTYPLHLKWVAKYKDAQIVLWKYIVQCVTVQYIN